MQELKNAEGGSTIKNKREEPVGPEFLKNKSSRPVYQLINSNHGQAVAILNRQTQRKRPGLCLNRKKSN